MASPQDLDSIPHMVRTAQDPRQQELHRAAIAEVRQINSRIRLVRLEIAPDDDGNGAQLPVSSPPFRLFFSFLSKPSPSNM